MGFDKQRFASLLEKALGGKSGNEFSKICRVDPAHISRLRRAMTKAPPAPETIKKIVGAAENRVTYEEMMYAAGHLTPAQLPDDEQDTAQEKRYAEEKLYNLSFLDTEVAGWVGDPVNAEYIMFIYRAFKNGITRELLGRAKLMIDVNN